MMKPLNQKMVYLKIVSSVAILYPVLFYALLDQFILHQSDVTTDNKVVYCIESCKPRGYYLQWNDDLQNLSVGFYVSAAIYNYMCTANYQFLFT